MHRELAIKITHLQNMIIYLSMLIFKQFIVVGVLPLKVTICWCLYQVCVYCNVWKWREKRDHWEGSEFWPIQKDKTQFKSLLFIRYYTESERHFQLSSLFVMTPGVCVYVCVFKKKQHFPLQFKWIITAVLLYRLYPNLKHFRIYGYWIFFWQNCGTAPTGTNTLYSGK